MKFQTVFPAAILLLALVSLGGCGPGDAARGPDAAGLMAEISVYEAARAFPAADRSIAATETDRIVRLGFLRRIEDVDAASIAPPLVRRLSSQAILLSDALSLATLPFGDIRPGDPRPFPVTHLTGSVVELGGDLLAQRPAERASAEAWLAQLPRLAAAIRADRVRLEADAEAGSAPPDLVLRATLRLLQEWTPSSAAGHPLFQSFSAALRSSGSLAPDEQTRLLDECAVLITNEILPATLQLRRGLERLSSSAPPSLAAIDRGDDFFPHALSILSESSLAPPDIVSLLDKESEALLATLAPLLKAAGFPDGEIGLRLRRLDSDERYRSAAGPQDPRMILLQRRFAVWAAAASPDITSLPSLASAAAEGAPFSSALLHSPPADGRLWLAASRLAGTSAIGPHVFSAPQGPSTQIWAGPALALREGWRQYAEDLALEEGAFRDDPQGRIGHAHSRLIAAESARADIRVHTSGITPAEAIQTLAERTGLPADACETIVTDILARPGFTASAYLARLRIHRIRSDAEALLEDAFSRVAFHDIVLGGGIRPLAEVETEVQDWIAARRTPR